MRPAAAPPIPVADSEPRDRTRIAAIGFAGVVYAFLYLPLVVMAVFSFNEATVQTLPLKGFSLKWYDKLANDSAMIDALVYSLKVSVIAVAVSAVAGTGFALLFTQTRARGMRVLQAAIGLPFVMPGMVLGISLLLTFRQIGVAPGMLAIVAAHVAFITPVIMFVVAQRLSALDPSFAQASMDLGAGPLRTFVNVILPSIRTALLAAMLLAFTVSFDEVIVTFFVSGSQQTLPVHIWTLLRQGFSPAVNAILTLIAVFSVTVVTLATIKIARASRTVERRAR